MSFQHNKEGHTKPFSEDCRRKEGRKEREREREEVQSTENCLLVLNYETHLFVCEIICCTLQPNSRVTVLQGTLCKDRLQSNHESEGGGVGGTCRQGLCLPAVFGK
jgi:hypothetical protein